MNTPSKIHAVLVLWSPPFIAKWAHFSLRTLMLPGNLPALAKRCPLVLHVFTDRASVPTLREAAAPYLEIGELVIHVIEETSVLGFPLTEAFRYGSDSLAKNTLDRASVYHVHELALKEGGNPLLLLLCSDFIVTDDSFANGLRFIEDGYKAVCAPTLRISQERSGWTADNFLVAQDGQASLPARSIVSRFPDMLHSVTRSHIVGEIPGTPYPVNFIWKVGSSGYVCRSHFAHPLFLRAKPGMEPPLSTVDYAVAPRLHRGWNDILVPGSSDQLLVCKLSTDGHLPGTTRDQPMDMELIVNFLLFNTNRAHRVMASQPFRLVGRDGTPQEWRQAERESLEVLDQAYDWVDRAIPKLPDSPDSDAWYRSFYGPIDDFLCPGTLGIREDQGVAPPAKVWIAL